MTDRITYRQIVTRLGENDLPYGILALQNDVRIVISQRGGRILGPFLSQEGESVFWTNPAFARQNTFKAFLDADDWNLGGDRMWIAPEIQYNIEDRSDFWGTYKLPTQVDPGHYTLSQPGAGQWLLSQDMALKAHNVAAGRKRLHLEKLIRPVEDPLRKLSRYPDLMHEVIFAGYEQVISLSEEKQDNIMSEAWNIIQLQAGGWLMIPAVPGVEYTNYYEPVDEDLYACHSHHLRFKITGTRQYKVGLKAAHVFGRVAYFNQRNDGRAYLIVRHFFNNPSASYAEEPDHSPGCQGHSIHIYNDGGQFGGFGELECNGQTIGASTGRSSSTDQFVLWLYQGPTDKVKTIAFHLLGIEL